MLIPERKLAEHQRHRHEHDGHRHESEDEQPARADEQAALRPDRHAVLSLNSFSASRFASMSSRTRLMARWLDVYLNSDQHHHAGRRCEQRGRQPARHEADRREQPFAQRVGRRVEPDDDVRERRPSLDVPQAAQLIGDLPLGFVACAS